MRTVPPATEITLTAEERQALEALTGQSHDYRRNGTTTLLAALSVGTGEVTGKHYQRRRRVEFLDFMNSVVADHECKEI